MGKVHIPGIKFGAPTITSDGGGASATVSVANGETYVTTVVAVQRKGGGTINYSITGGADAALFDILDATGDLYFLVAPAADTTWTVIVTATAGRGGGTDSQTISVEVGSGVVIPPAEFLPHFPVLFA